MSIAFRKLIPLTLLGSLITSVPAHAQATYEYAGNPFTLFSCGPRVPGPGTILCSSDKLNNALASIQAGLTKQAVNQLNAFINSVESSVKNQKMSAQSGTTVINAANAIIATL